MYFTHIYLCVYIRTAYIHTHTLSLSLVYSYTHIYITHSANTNTQNVLIIISFSVSVSLSVDRLPTSPVLVPTRSITTSNWAAKKRCYE